tara:strand:- start:1 stop:231 length:231 start_codon:yes stop_codon:yes gene_type:complete
MTGNLYDPNQPSFMEQAISTLGMTEEDVQDLRINVSVELLLIKAGISEDDVSKALESRIRTIIEETQKSLTTLADF